MLGIGVSGRKMKKKKKGEGSSLANQRRFIDVAPGASLHPY